MARLREDGPHGVGDLNDRHRPGVGEHRLAGADERLHGRGVHRLDLGQIDVDIGARVVDEGDHTPFNTSTQCASKRPLTVTAMSSGSRLTVRCMTNSFPRYFIGLYTLCHARRRALWQAVTR